MAKFRFLILAALACLTVSPSFVDASGCRNECFCWEGDCDNPEYCRTLVWMPECCPLFKPMIANPRQVNYSVGWRYNDKIFADHVVDISFADSFPIFRICNLVLQGDAIQADLQGGLWALFDHLSYSAPLINADYYVGAVLTYAYKCWSSRFRFYHISSHIGDEFLLNNPDFDRRNPSAEYLEWAVAYQLTEDFRIYGAYTYVMSCDSSFPFCKNRFEAGLEAYFNFWLLRSYSHCIFGRPFFAVHLRYFEDYNFEEDITYALGYELSKMRGLCRKLRFYLEYHKGFSVEGQFSDKKTDYISLRASYGF